MTIPPIPNDLVHAVRSHRIVPFVGAGVSMGVRSGLFPSWRALLERLAALLEEDGAADDAARVHHLLDTGDYPQAAEVAYEKLGPFRFNRALRGAIRVARPERGDLSVPQALWALHPPLVITTNYDEVLRWAGPSNLSVVANDQNEELALLNERSAESPWLWHLHGTIDRLGTVILAGSDYRRLYGDDGSSRAKDYEHALFRLRAAMVDYPLLYVGFSLSDPFVLQQIKHVLDLTDRKGPRSYALMKKGQGNAGALWSNYNIQLVEYEDHGGPLAELLHAIAERAFPPAPPLAMRSEYRRLEAFESFEPERRLTRSAAPAPEAPPMPAPPPPSRPAPVPRPALEDAYLRSLRDNRRLLLLSPRRGGARTLARSIARRAFGDRVTTLTPPNVPGCTAQEYFRALSGQEHVDGFLPLLTWLHERAAHAGGAEHLIVLENDGGPLEHLSTLGNALRRLLDEERSPFLTLVPGSAACAILRFDAPSFSLFHDAFVRHVPPLSVDEVRDALTNAGLDAGKAGEVHTAIGGLPGLLEEVVLGGTVDAATITDRLAQSPAVRGTLRMRLSEDDRGALGPKWHARWALQEMLAGCPVRKLAEVEDQLKFPEVRLYYDGLVVADEANGATVFRCEAARVAAVQALRVEDGP